MNNNSKTNQPLRRGRGVKVRQSRLDTGVFCLPRDENQEVTRAQLRFHGHFSVKIDTDAFVALFDTGFDFLHGEFDTGLTRVKNKTLASHCHLWLVARGWWLLTACWCLQEANLMSMA